MKGNIISSVILGACIVVASLFISGVINLKDEHVLETTAGAVKLGNVYSEKELIRISAYGKNDNDTKFRVFEMKYTTPDLYKEKLKDIIDNTLVTNYTDSEKESKNKTTYLDLTFSKDVYIKIDYLIDYNSEYQPDFKLNIDSVKYDGKGELIYSSIVSHTDDLIKSQADVVKKLTFLHGGV